MKKNQLLTCIIVHMKITLQIYSQLLVVITNLVSSRIQNEQEKSTVFLCTDRQQKRIRKIIPYEIASPTKHT